MPDKDDNCSTDHNQNETRDAIAASAVSLSSNAKGLLNSIVSHTTDSQKNVTSILNQGIHLQSHNDNLFGGRAFYTAEHGYSIGEANGDFTIAFELDRKMKIFDITHPNHEKYALMKHEKIIHHVLANDYDALRYEGSSVKFNRAYSYNLAIFRNPQNLTPIGVYPTPKEDTFPPIRSIFAEAIPNPTAISIPTIRGIQALGAVGMGVAIIHSVQKINESNAPVTETLHQGTLLSAALWGGTKAGIAAIKPCGSVGIYFPPLAPYSVPVCIASTSIAGGAIAAFAADVTWSVTSALSIKADKLSSLKVEEHTKIITATFGTTSTKLTCHAMTINQDGNSATIAKCSVEKKSSENDKNETKALTITKAGLDHKDLYEVMVNNQLTLGTIQPSLTVSTVAEKANVERLQNHLSSLEKSNPSSSAMISRSLAISSSHSRMSEHLQSLKDSQNNFNSCLTSARCTDYSQFTNQSRQTYHFDTASEAARYSTFFSNYVNGNFCERPKPKSNHSVSFWKGSNREGGKSGGQCDSRFENCSSTSSNDCRSGGSDRCSSSLFK